MDRADEVNDLAVLVHPFDDMPVEDDAQPPQQADEGANLLCIRRITKEALLEKSQQLFVQNARQVITPALLQPHAQNMLQEQRKPYDAVAHP